MRARVPLVGRQHADAPRRQRRAQRLRVADDLGHVVRAEGDHLGGADRQRGDTVDLMRGCQHGEDGVGQRFRQRRVVPDDEAALRAAEGFARRAGQHGRALAQRVLELPPGDEAGLMRPVEEQLAAPIGQDVAHLLHGEGEEGHRRAQGDQLRPNQRGHAPEQVEVDGQLLRVHRHIDHLQAAHAGRAVGPVAGVTAKGLGDAHDDVARLGQRGVDGQVADHAGDEAVIGVAGAEGALQQFDA